MSLVSLVSGGLDSSLINALALEEGVEIYPLFIDYGQLAADREWGACTFVHKDLGFPEPSRVDISGFGKLIESGLTSDRMHVNDKAFTPGRNLLLLVVGAAYAFQKSASAIAIGLLAEKFSLFPDQGAKFISSAEKAIEEALGKSISVVTPLSEFSKADVIKLADEKGISGTYSCHSGTKQPCGICVSCQEVAGLKD